LVLAAVSPLASHQLLLLLLQVGVLLLVAFCLGMLARRLGLPSIVGELLAGVLLGPSVLGWAMPRIATWLFPPDADQAHLLDAVSQLGVLLLVGVVGGHLDGALVRRRGGTVVRVAGTALLIPLILGIVTGYLVPKALLNSSENRTTFAAFLGVAMCMSAIPVIAKTLADMNLLHRDVGQLTLAAATIDDAIGWFLLSLVSAMAVGGLAVGPVTTSLFSLVGYVMLAAFVGRPVVRAVLRVAGRQPDPGPITMITVVIILLSAAGTHALGLEAAFGAFVAGVLIGSRGGADPRRLAPLRTVVMSVLAPIYFAGVGLRIDFTALSSPVVALAGLCILFVAILGKFAGAYAGARLSRLGHWEALALGAGLNARGVVEIVVATIGLRLGVLSVEMYTIVVLVAVLTSVMAPPVLRWSMARVDLSTAERLRETEFGFRTGPPVAAASTSPPRQPFENTQPTAADAK
jgi:Kef-type K+ transport system membrane component KefB